MTITSYFSSFLFPRNHNTNSTAPLLSLTAQDGCWIRTSDYIGFRNILLLSVKDIQKDKTIEWLRSFSNRRFEEINCTIFCITTKTPEHLREIKNKIDLDYSLLYDPFALEARKFGMSGRRPMCRDSAVLINQDGLVVFSACGQPTSPEIFAQGTSLFGFTEDIFEEPAQVSSNAVQLMPSDNAVQLLMDKSKYKLVDVRTLSEYEPDHVPGSLHIPIDELHQRYLEIGQLNSILFICQAGGRAYSAAEFIASIGGIELIVVEGGMSSWSGPRKTDGKIS
jgi:rhodanese-related sulfurtransferase/peroxiredoxin